MGSFVILAFSKPVISKIIHPHIFIIIMIFYIISYMVQFKIIFTNSFQFIIFQNTKFVNLDTLSTPLMISNRAMYMPYLEAKSQNIDVCVYTLLMNRTLLESWCYNCFSKELSTYRTANSSSR